MPIDNNNAALPALKLYQIKKNKKNNLTYAINVLSLLQEVMKI